jgi:hypothetical protein
MNGLRKCGIYVQWIFCVCVVLGLELRAFTLSHSTSPIFVKGFFEIESRKNFFLAWAGFEP